MQVRLTQSKHPYDIETEATDPKLPSVFVFSGSRGSGKTYACVSMVRYFEKKKYVTRTFLISPTYKSQPIFHNLKTLEPKDVCDNEHYFNAALHEIVNEVKSDWKTFEDIVAYRNLYAKYKSSPHTLTFQEHQVLEFKDYEEPEPQPPRPSHCLIIDDCQGTHILANGRKSFLNHMVIKHRHIPMTMCFLAQSWTGIPRVVRLNATHFALYLTGDKNQLKQIYDAFANTIDFDDFQRIYRLAAMKPHGFLFIDTTPKKEKFRFRDGLGDFIKVNKNT